MDKQVAAHISDGEIRAGEARLGGGAGEDSGQVERRRATRGAVQEVGAAWWIDQRGDALADFTPSGRGVSG